MNTPRETVVSEVSESAMKTSTENLEEALDEYAKRNRRFGGV